MTHPLESLILEAMRKRMPCAPKEAAADVVQALRRAGALPPTNHPLRNDDAAGLAAAKEAGGIVRRWVSGQGEEDFDVPFAPV